MRNFTLVLYIFISILFRESSSFMDYIWPKSESTSYEDTDIKLRNIPFELNENDEKFLQHANEIMGLKTSDLDKCYNRVIFILKKSCHDLNSEELGKLAVLLLNCQSAIEGRELYPCTENMSLKDCTSDMNPDTWNAYHLITNRAKAVCYRIRQEQFQGLTEITVNKLMNTAQIQINMMNDISENQKRLDDQTQRALKTIQIRNMELMEQQRFLAQGQAEIRSAVDGNIRTLLNEKALMKIGRAKITVIMEKLLKQIEWASDQLDTHTQQRSKDHHEMLNDLREVHKSVADISSKIEQSSLYLSEQHANALEKYHRTIEQLKHISSTINFLDTILNNTRSEIDRKLSILNSLFFGTGCTMDMLLIIFSYIFYIPILMIIASFLNLSVKSRIIIFTIIISNIALENCNNMMNIKPMNMKEMTVFIIFALIGRLAILKTMEKYATCTIKSLNDKIAEGNTLKSNKVEDIVDRSGIENNFTAYNALKDSHSELSKETNSFYEFDHLNSLPGYTPPVSRAETSNSGYRRLTPSVSDLNRTLCEAITRKGSLCKNPAMHGRMSCVRHRTEHQSELKREDY